MFLGHRAQHATIGVARVHLGWLSFRSLRLAPSGEALGPAVRIKLDRSIGRITP
jgi:hypothetical protein